MMSTADRAAAAAARAASAATASSAPASAPYHQQQQQLPPKRSQQPQQAVKRERAPPQFQGDMSAEEWMEGLHPQWDKARTRGGHALPQRRGIPLPVGNLILVLCSL